MAYVEVVVVVVEVVVVWAVDVVVVVVVEVVVFEVMVVEVVVMAYCQLSCSVTELPFAWHVVVSRTRLAQHSYVVVPLKVEIYLYCAVPYGRATVRYHMELAFV